MGGVGAGGAGVGTLRPGIVGGFPSCGGGFAGGDYGSRTSTMSTMKDLTYQDQIRQVSASVCLQRKGHLAEEGHHLR